MSDTLIVGFVGFLGVMVTLWWNARQQRQLEERRECREAMGLRKALIEELKQQRAALRETADSLAAQATSIRAGAFRVREARAADSAVSIRQGTVIPVERYDGVFRVSLDKVGLLERPEVRAVLEAYLPLPRLTWRLRMLELAERTQEEGPFEIAEDHVSLSPRNYATAGKMHDQLVPAIDAAIAELERNKE
jgi:hypothetical protein